MIDERGWTTPWEANFREHMKALREAQGWTQSELARRLKARGLPYHQQTVQRVETGERPVRLDEAFHIAAELGTHIDVMVQSNRAGVSDAVFAVTRLQRESEQVDGYISETFDDWFTAYNEVVNAFHELLELTGNRPTRHVRWAAAWVLKAKWVLEAVNDTTMFLNGVTTQKADWREAGMPVTSQAPEWIDDENADIWRGLAIEDQPIYLADLSPHELNDYLRGEDNGEHSEAV